MSVETRWLRLCAVRDEDYQVSYLRRQVSCIFGDKPGYRHRVVAIEKLDSRPRLRIPESLYDTLVYSLILEIILLSLR